jgi:hypothetical protein
MIIAMSKEVGCSFPQETRHDFRIAVGVPLQESATPLATLQYAMWSDRHRRRVPLGMRPDISTLPPTVESTLRMLSPIQKSVMGHLFYAAERAGAETVADLQRAEQSIDRLVSGSADSQRRILRQTAAFMVSLFTPPELKVA